MTYILRYSIEKLIPRDENSSQVTHGRSEWRYLIDHVELIRRLIVFSSRPVSTLHLFEINSFLRLGDYFPTKDVENEQSSVQIEK